jgi:hypothetical protein
MELDFALVMNVWGLNEKHMATCLLIPRNYAPWLPEDLLRELKSSDTLERNYYPSPLFKEFGGKKGHDSRLSSVFTASALSSQSKRDTISIVFERFRSWSQWSEDKSITQAQSEAQLVFVRRDALLGSHRCGQANCIINLIFESEELNTERDACLPVNSSSASGRGQGRPSILYGTPARPLLHAAPSINSS